MATFTPEKINSALLDSVHHIASHRDEYLKNPQKDFSRNRKISFEQTMLFPIVATNGTLSTEMLDFFPEENLPSVSAFIQQLSKFKEHAFEALFKNFTAKIPRNKKFQNLHLIACDGSHLNAPYNPKNEFSYTKPIDSRKGFNQYILNTFYDVLNNTFLDAVIQGYHTMNETDAFCTMLKRYSEALFSALFLLDRGYCTYNLIAHVLHSNQYLLVRAQDKFIRNLSKDYEAWEQQDSFDIDVTVHVGRRVCKSFKALENYHNVPPRRRYDFAEVNSDQVDCLKFRVLKFKLSESNYEYIITNLPRNTFPLTTIKELYHLRWNIETAYRNLKYADGLVHFHSLKNEFSFHEIYAKLTLHNFTFWLESLVPQSKQGGKKYKYVTNKTQAAKLCICYIKGKVMNILSLLGKEKVPVRPDRSFPRNIRKQSADTLNNR